MLEPQALPVPMDTEYGIDVLLDEMSIDAATANVVTLYGDREIIADIMHKRMPNDERDYLDSWRSARQQTRTAAARLMAYGTDLIGQLPPEKQGAFASIALTHMDYTTRHTAEFMAHWAIGDKAEGGYGEDYNRPPRCQKNSVWPYKKDVRRLYAPAWIRRYVKQEDECRRVRRIGSVVTGRLTHLDPELIAGGIEVFRVELQEADQRRQAYEAQQWEQIREDMRAGATAQEVLFEPRITFKKRVLANLRKRDRKERKILKRGMATANLIVGEDKTRAFLKGEAVTLEGVNLDLVVTKRGRAAGLDYSQIGLAAATKDGTKLADLCFYIEDTPAIDQLTAVALHAAAGEEQDIVNIANIINIAPVALDHPAFVAKSEAQAVARIMAAAEDRTPIEIEDDAFYIPNLAKPHLTVSFRDRARDRDQQYWQDTKHIWLEATGVYLLGAKHHKLMQQNASAS